MSKRTKITAIIIVVAAAAIIAAGATLAYFTADGGTKTNTFTTGEVKVELSEPSWKPENGSKYGPGDIIPKDPQVTNTDKTDAWVAIRVKYSLHSGFLSYENFKNKLLANNGLDFQLGDQPNQWTKIAEVNENGQLYMYNTKLSQGQKTEQPLFNNVPIGFNNIELIDGQLPTFAIDVQGFGVQAENITPEKAQEELINLAFN